METNLKKGKTGSDFSTMFEKMLSGKREGEKEEGGGFSVKGLNVGGGVRFRDA